MKLKESGCVNPYHPPECPRADPAECIRDNNGWVVISEEEWRAVWSRGVNEFFRKFKDRLFSSRKES